MNNNKQNIIDDLLILFLLNEANEQQINELNDWLEQSYYNRQYFEEYKKLWSSSKNITPKPIYVDIDKAWTKVNTQILFNEKNKNKKSILWYSVRIAAVLLLFVGIFLLFKQILKPKKIFVQSSELTLLDTLSDGSIITLNKNSKIVYFNNFSKDNRNIKLEGEAFFEVANIKNKPFIIDAGEGFIEVIGTKFNVNTLDSMYINVYVESGKVKLFSIKPNTYDTLSVILTSGDKGRINKFTKETEKFEAKIENSNAMFWTNNTLKFNSCELKNVIEILEKTYNIDIEIDENISNLQLSATFENENIDQIIEIICLTFNLKVSKNNNNYYLNVTE